VRLGCRSGKFRSGWERAKKGVVRNGENEVEEWDVSLAGRTTQQMEDRGCGTGGAWDQEGHRERLDRRETEMVEWMFARIGGGEKG